MSIDYDFMNRVYDAQLQRELSELEKLKEKIGSSLQRELHFGTIQERMKEISTRFNQRGIEYDED